MSSRPPPASPVYPPSLQATTLPMTEIQRAPQVGLSLHPLPPSTILQPPYTHDASVRHLPPLYQPSPGILPSPPALPPYTHHSPPLLQSPVSSAGGERWSAAPLSRLLSGPTYSPPKSDPSYSPRYSYSLPPRAEAVARPPEGPPSAKRPRLDLSAHSSTRTTPPLQRQPSHSHSSSATTAATFDTPSQTQTATGSREIRPSIDNDRYEIRVRQQPLAARACGFGERDRRVIDPPPIVQLVVKESEAGKQDSEELRYPFNVVHCTLWNEHNTMDETALNSHDRKVTRRLMGTLVSSPFVGLDENDEEGCFFCFPDLSCRTNGNYRLRFVLMRIEANELNPGGWTPIITETTSEVFTVFTAKDFPGMRASTALTKALKRQGCAISVKKGNEKPSVRAKDEDSGEEDAVALSSGGAGSKRKRKR